MPNLNNPSVEFLTRCIARLEEQAGQVNRAIATLRMLLAGADSLDPDHIRTMARAVMEQSLSPEARPQHRGHGPGFRQRSLFDEDDWISFDPARPPAEQVTTQEETIFKRIADFLVAYGNRPMSINTLATGGTAEQSWVVKAMCVTHPHRFEKVRTSNNQIRWRLRPEYFSELAEKSPPKSPRGPQPVPVESPAGTAILIPTASLTQTEAAALVLRAAGKPLPTGEIVDRITREGLYPTENIRDLKQFNNAVFSAMSRKASAGDTFVKVSPGTWGLLEWSRDGDSKESVAEGASAPAAPEGAAG